MPPVAGRVEAVTGDAAQQEAAAGLWLLK